MSKQKILADAKKLMELRDDISFLQSQERELANRLKDKINIGEEVKGSTVIVWVEEQHRTSFNKDKLVSKFGEKEIKKYEKVVTYAVLKVREI